MDLWTRREVIGTLSRRSETVLRAYLAALAVELLPDAPIFRTRGGVPYTKNSLAEDFCDVRALVLVTRAG